jgi:hypothetical protein
MAGVSRSVLTAGVPLPASVGLCGFAGPRLGETAAVRVADVGFLRRTLTVARQVQGARLTWPTAEDRRRAAVCGQLRAGRGLEHFHMPLTSANESCHTLKRNSTTSPSCMT